MINNLGKNTWGSFLSYKSQTHLVDDKYIHTHTHNHFICAQWSAFSTLCTRKWILHSRVGLPFPLGWVTDQGFYLAMNTVEQSEKCEVCGPRWGTERKVRRKLSLGRPGRSCVSAVLADWRRLWWCWRWLAAGLTGGCWSHLGPLTAPSCLRFSHLEGYKGFWDKLDEYKKGLRWKEIV